MGILPVTHSGNVMGNIMWVFYLKHCGDVSWNTVRALNGSRSCLFMSFGVTGFKS